MKFTGIQYHLIYSRLIMFKQFQYVNCKQKRLFHLPSCLKYIYLSCLQQNLLLLLYLQHKPA